MQQKNTIIWCMLTQLWSACTDIIFWHFRPFCFFAPLLTPTIKIWKKCKKAPGHIILYTCVPLTKIIWCMVPETWSSTDRIFWSSWAIFCPFTPPPPSTIKKENIKNEKNPGDIIIYTRVPKIMIICYILFQRYGTWQR